MRQPGAPIGDYKVNASPLMLAAIAQIEASAAAAVERAKRRDADKTYQFLSRVYTENDPQFLSADALMTFLSSATYCRRQRADKLRFIRQAVILMGRCNTRRKLLEACKALRREEKVRSHSVRVMDRIDACIETLRTMEFA